MFRKIIQGSLRIVPSICSTLEQLMFGANEGYTYALAELNNIKGLYEHIYKKIMSIANVMEYSEEQMEFNSLGKTLRATPTGSGDHHVSKEHIERLMELSERVLKRFNDDLKKDFSPLIIRKYFCTNLSEIGLEECNDLNDEIKGLKISKFNESMFDAINWANKFGLKYYETYNLLQDKDADKLISFKSMMSDSILALSRIRPDRKICVNDYYILHSDFNIRWVVPDYKVGEINIVRHLMQDDSISIEIVIGPTLVALIKEYMGLYTFTLEFEYSKYDDPKVEMNIKPIINPTAKNSPGPNKQRPNMTNYSIGSKSQPLDANVSSYTMKMNCTQFDLRPIFTSCKCIGKPVINKIHKQNFKDLHNIKIDDPTYGDILKYGSYTVEDPIYSIASIYRHSIGTAQYSLPIVINMLIIWINEITQRENLDIDIMSRYGDHKASFKLTDLITLQHSFHTNTKFNTEDNLRNYIELISRVILDLKFMSKYLPNSIYFSMVIQEYIEGGI